MIQVIQDRVRGIQILVVCGREDVITQWQFIFLSVVGFISFAYIYIRVYIYIYPHMFLPTLIPEAFAYSEREMLSVGPQPNSSAGDQSSCSQRGCQRDHEKQR